MNQRSLLSSKLLFLELEMIVQLISVVCTMGFVVLAILIMTRAIPLEEALKEIGKTLLILVGLSFAVCWLGPPLHAALNALVILLTTMVRWIVVAVFFTLALMILIRVLSRKSGSRSHASRPE